MRGLKLVDGEEETGSEVASFTDAWIETIDLLGQENGVSRIFYRCVD